MNPAVERFLEAARVPHALEPQRFGRWIIERAPNPGDDAMRAQGLPPIGWPDLTLLKTRPAPNPDDPFAAEMDCGHAFEVVMEDSRRELSQHLPIWLAARGRVLVTGLGLGCVVRGLLASPAVEHVDVVEIDADILRVVGAEFAANERVTLHHADALTKEWPPGTAWAFAWHDLWTDGPRQLQELHAELMGRTRRRCPRQGAWKLPRLLKRTFAGVVP